MYIAIEGIDTAGKSTQIELLRKYFFSRFQENSNDIIITKEPYSNSLRAIALDGDLISHTAEMFIFLADRAEHIERVIKTCMDKAHEIPGSTSSNIFQKGKYNSQKEALVTIDELEE